MSLILTAESDLYYICHNNVDVCHSGFLPTGLCLETGQPFRETFDTEEEMKARIEELGINTEE